MPYPWMSPDWAAKAAAAEMKVQPLLSRRRWTDKDVIGGHVVFWPDWPLIPKGVGAEYGGERALRVFIEITDGDEAHEAPQEAFLVARLSGADAGRARLTKDDTYLVVPHRFFDWAGGALSFDKKVLLSLPSKIARHGFDHEDAEIGPEIVWITPMKAADRKYYYAVLPLVGMGGIIDPARGNPSFFTGITTLWGVNFPGIQPDRLRHTVWWLVDRMIGAGITSWGDFAPGRNGEREVFAIKLELIHFLRGIADHFVEEGFAAEVRRGAFDRGSVEKAVGKGLWHHLPDAERIAKENHWLERADMVDLARAARAARAFRSYKGAGPAIARGVGEGWAADPQVEANRRVLIEALCGAFDIVAQRSRREVLAEEDAEELEKLAREEYLKGNITLELADIISDHRLTCPPEDTADGIVDDWLGDFEPKLRYFLAQYPA